MGGIIPLRRAALSRYDGRLRQESAASNSRAALTWSPVVVISQPSPVHSRRRAESQFFVKVKLQGRCSLHFPDPERAPKWAVTV